MSVSPRVQAFSEQIRQTIKESDGDNYEVVRTDKQGYPEGSIREALLNVLVHRDYSFSSSIIINVNDNKTEFISLGGLLPDSTEH